MKKQWKYEFAKSTFPTGLDNTHSKISISKFSAVYCLPPIRNISQQAWPQEGFLSNDHRFIILLLLDVSGAGASVQARASESIDVFEQVSRQTWFLSLAWLSPAPLFFLSTILTSFLLTQFWLFERFVAELAIVVSSKSHQSEKNPSAVSRPRARGGPNVAITSKG